MKMKRPIILPLLLAGLMLASGCVPTESAVQTPAQTQSALPVEEATPTPVASPSQAPATPVKFTALEMDTAFSADIDGDGVEETLLLTEEADEESAFGTSVFLTVTKGGEEQKTKLVQGTFFGAYSMESEGKNGLVVSATFENDVQLTYTFALSGGAPVALAEIYGGILTAENGTAVLLGRLYALGTWSVEIAYKIDLAFGFAPAQGKEWTVLGCEHPLTVKKALPVQMDDNGVSREETLSVGTKLWLTDSDGSSYVRFVLEDNRQGMLFYEMKDGIATLVDGTPDSDWLDDIIYAG